MDKLKLAEQALINEDVPNFRSGDRVNVHYRVREGKKERIQQFEGDVISRHGSGANQTFMVRKISFGNIGVERIFPLNSPFIAKIEVMKEGDVKRSKLYYLRERSGKSARIKERDTRDTDSEELADESEAKEEVVAETESVEEETAQESAVKAEETSDEIETVKQESTAAESEEEQKAEAAKEAEAEEKQAEESGAETDKKKVKAASEEE